MDDNKTWSIVESATDQQDTMDLDTADTDTVRVGAATPRVDNASLPPTDATRSTPDPSALSSTQHATMQAPLEPNFREMQVKVHVRRPGRDTWTYLGRASVTQEIVGHSSRVVIRQASTGKILTVFSELSDVQAEKRGNFVVLGSVENGDVISWSLNAINNSETLKLLASIELACYRCGLAMADPTLHTKIRRRIDRMIKEDRRRRHRLRKADDALADAFGRQTLG